MPLERSLSFFFFARRWIGKLWQFRLQRNKLFTKRKMSDHIPKKIREREVKEAYRWLGLPLQPLFTRHLNLTCRHFSFEAVMLGNPKWIFPGWIKISKSCLLHFLPSVYVSGLTPLPQKWRPKRKLSLHSEWVHTSTKAHLLNKYPESALVVHLIPPTNKEHTCKYNQYIDTLSAHVICC